MRQGCPATTFLLIDMRLILNTDKSEVSLFLDGGAGDQGMSDVFGEFEALDKASPQAKKVRAPAAGGKSRGRKGK
jgi:hypothetical protein